MVLTYQNTFTNLIRGEASYTSPETMNLYQYIFSELLCVYDDEFKNLPYAERYQKVFHLYEQFHSSTYNNDGTYSNVTARMCNYLDANEHRKVQVGDEIIESLKQFDDIDYDVWKYVSQKMGYTILEKVDIPSDDSEKFNT